MDYRIIEESRKAHFPYNGPGLEDEVIEMIFCRGRIFRRTGEGIEEEVARSPEDLKYENIARMVGRIYSKKKRDDLPIHIFVRKNSHTISGLCQRIRNYAQDIPEQGIPDKYIPEC